MILDIFAQRARTSEGKLQVELAQLTYLLPRLVGQWAHLERLGGGIGTRGPGETQLESDRRVVRRRIGQIHEALEDVQRHRRLLRTHRRDVGLPVVALVGYTNAGKTTLLNRTAGASAPTADQLFVTLDPTARLVSGRGRARFVLTDTVGFIQKLPTQLVAAFKATLEELDDAQLLLHVVDISHSHAREHMSAVYRVLEELGLEDRPALVVMNKIDRLPEPNGLLRELWRRAGSRSRPGPAKGSTLCSPGSTTRSAWRGRCVACGCRTSAAGSSAGCTRAGVCSGARTGPTRSISRSRSRERSRASSGLSACRIRTLPPGEPWRRLKWRSRATLEEAGS